MSLKQQNSELFERAAETAEDFVGSYYRTFDAQRGKILTLYTEESIASWNGKAYAGRRYGEFLLTLPASEHRIDCFDSHPILASAVDGQTNFLLVVSGTVNYGKSGENKRFSSTFVLAPIPSQPNVFYIKQECLRFV